MKHVWVIYGLLGSVPMIFKTRWSARLYMAGLVREGARRYWYKIEKVEVRT